jgi:hypothetical protein
MVSRKQDLQLNAAGKAPGPGAYDPFKPDKQNQPSYKYYS